MLTILNEKIYFITNLFQFISLPAYCHDALKETRDAASLSNLKAEVVETCIMIDEKTKESFTAYLIEINSLNNEKLDKIKRKSRFIKRFSDFEKLHKSLGMRFERERLFPSFPSKNFGILNKTTITKRKKALEQYLNSLFKVPGIEDSFAMRNFIQSESEDYRESYQESVALDEREENEEQGVNLIDSNHLEELSLATMKFN